MRNIFSSNDVPVVLFVIDSLEIGGAEKSILEISSRFKKFKPIVVTLYKGSHLKQEYLKRGVDVISFDFEEKEELRIIVEKLQGIVDSIRPRIIHATLIRSCLISRRLSRKYPYKLINSFVNNTYGIQRYRTLRPARAMKLFFIQIKDAVTSSKVDLFISNSETIKKTTSRALKIPKNKIKVVYRGRNPHVYEKHDNMDLRRDLGVAEKSLFICVGRLIKRKGQLDLVNAFEKLLTKDSDCHLFLVGEGPLRPALEKLIKEKGLHQKVTLLGQRNDVPELLNISDFFVFPSYYEGLPGALVEAMFSKIPIIASNIPENLECVTTKTARIFNPGEIPKMAEQLQKAKEDENWAMRSDLAYIYALDNFSIENISIQYEKIYEQFSFQ